MPCDLHASAEGARMARLSELAASALQRTALQVVLSMADELMELSCADLLEATKPPPTFIRKEDESWGVFGSDSEEDEASEDHSRSPASSESAEPEAATAAVRERAAATAAVAGIRDAIAALRQAGANTAYMKHSNAQLVGKDDVSWGLFGSDDEEEQEQEQEGDGDAEVRKELVEQEEKQGCCEKDCSGSSTASVAATRAAAAARDAAACGWGELQAAAGWSNPAWREVFCLSSVAGAVASTLVSPSPPADDTHQRQLQEAMQAADLAFILGCPPAVCRPVCALIDHRLRELIDAAPEAHTMTRPAVSGQRPTPAAATVVNSKAAVCGEEAPSLSCQSSSKNPLGAPEIKYPIPRVAQKALGLEEFEARFYKANMSVVLTGCTADWGDGVAALSTREGLWRYFAEVHGHRTVPVEIWQPVALSAESQGGSVQTTKDAAPTETVDDSTEEADDGLEERLMTLREFTTRHLLVDWSSSVDGDSAARDTSKVVNGNGTVAYLAQHALFDQIPALWELVRVFPWVNVGVASGAAVGSNNGSSSGLLHANVWLGEGGTITGLHFDSYDNFLLQLHGYKYEGSQKLSVISRAPVTFYSTVGYVRIYEKKQTRYLYRIPATEKGGDSGTGDVAGAGSLHQKNQRSGGAAAQGNLSAIGRAIEQDGVLDKFPLLAQAEYSEAILGPGDALYMPAGVWHYVRSLETSLSINYWF